MSIPTVTVSVRLAGPTGQPVPNADVHFELSTTEFYAGVIIPATTFSGTTDANGVAKLQVFPNELGSRGSFYTVRLPTRNHLGLYSQQAYKAVVPNRDCDLFEIAEKKPFPPTEMPLLVALETRVKKMEVGAWGGGWRARLAWPTG